MSEYSPNEKAQLRAMRQRETKIIMRGIFWIAVLVLAYILGRAIWYQLMPTQWWREW